MARLNLLAYYHIRFPVYPDGSHDLSPHARSVVFSDFQPLARDVWHDGDHHHAMVASVASDHTPATPSPR